MTEKTYRIFHNYDRGDQSVYVASLIDPTRAAIYCQFLAEDQLRESASVLNIGIAKALVQFYGCTPIEKTDSAIDLDLYFAREGLCGDYEQLMADQSLQREGIIDLIRPYTHGVGDDLKNIVAVAANAKDLLGMSATAADAILSNCRVQIEITPDQQCEQKQLLELHKTGHCGVTVTANYNPAQWERYQNIVSQATNQVFTSSPDSQAIPLQAE